jgi:hypothetical protein
MEEEALYFVVLPAGTVAKCLIPSEENQVMQGTTWVLSASPLLACLLGRQNMYYEQ